MNNPLNFSPSELLSAYLDGELSPQSEKLLFEKLAQSDELRTEMRDFLAIHKEIENGAMYYPPAALKTAAMAKAGLESAGAFAGALPLLKSALVPVVSALTGVVLTVLVMTNLAQDDSELAALKNENALLKSENGLLKTNIAQSNNTIELQKLEANIASEESAELQKILAKNEQELIAEKYKTQVFKRQAEQQLAALEKVLKTGPTAEIPESEAFKNITVLASNSLKSDERTPLKDLLKDVEESVTRPAILDEMSTEKTSWLENINFEMRGFSLANFPQPRTLPQSDPIFKNMAIGAYYRVNNTHAFGGEFGQEAFSQRFSEIEADSVVNWQQYLVLPWAGLSYRYTPDISFKNIRPMVGIFAGGSEGGPVTRAILGVQIFPENPVSMTIGGEAAAFAYQFKGKWFVSPKLGLTYGVSVKF
jgi:hypothetical protein